MYALSAYSALIIGFSSSSPPPPAPSVSEGGSAAVEALLLSAIAIFTFERPQSFHLWTLMRWRARHHCSTRSSSALVVVPVAGQVARTNAHLLPNRAQPSDVAGALSESSAWIMIYFSGLQCIRHFSLVEPSLRHVLSVCPLIGQFFPRGTHRKEDLLLLARISSLGLMKAPGKRRADSQKNHITLQEFKAAAGLSPGPADLPDPVASSQYARLS